MKKLNILLITYAFPPVAGAGTQRVASLAKNLVHRGHTVSVLTDNSVRKIDQKLLFNELQYIEVYHYSFEKLVNSKSERDSVITLVDHNATLDLVISTSPSSDAHTIARCLTRNQRIKWAADFRDIQSEYLRFFQFRKRKEIYQFEKKVFQQCDKVITISDYHKNYVIKHYNVKSDKIVVTPNGYNPGDFAISSKKHDTSYPEKDRITISHIGTFYGRRSPLLFFAFAFMTQTLYRTRFEILLVGDSGRYAQFLTKIFKKVLHIQEVGYVSHTNSISYAISSDVLVLIPGSFSKGVITGKVYEYLASGSYIINLYYKKGPLTTLLKGQPGVENVWQFNFYKFKNILLDLSKTVRADYSRDVKTRFSRDIQMCKLIQILEKI